MNNHQWVSPEIARIAPYEPGKPLEELARELGTAWPTEGAIKLASNENPLGPSPLGLAAAHAALASAQLYPDGGAFYLRQRLAQKLDQPIEKILCGSGSNELLDLLIQTFVAPDEEVLAPEVSFACYRLSAEAHRRAFRTAPNGPHFKYDLSSLARAVSPRTKLVFLANPNNPTGVYAGRAEFEAFLDQLPAHVILAVDEAYFEYARAADYPSTLDYLGRRERLCTLRTFSKIYGLAGLRAGYLVGPTEMVQHLNRVRLPFNISAVAQAAARAALDDVAHVERAQTLNAAELERVTAGLLALGLGVTPSQANFVLVDFGARVGKTVFDALLRQGVIVRPMAGYGLPHHLRITIGTAAENARLLATLAEVL